METMRFRETKKSSYKLQIFLIILFLSVGGGLTVFAISNEKDPVIIGQQQSDIGTTSNIDEIDALAKIEEPSSNASELYEITTKTISDKTFKKVKANLKIPVISVNGEPLTKLNDELYNKFNDTFNSFKKTMEKAENNFTYTVSYKSYENIIGNKNVVSITIHERMIDDNAKTNSMEKIYAYNIDLKDGTVLIQDSVAIDMLGADYKDKIKTSLKEYLVSKNIIKENEYSYSYTGLEKYYIKDGKFHLLFNPTELIDAKEILDIVI